MERSAVAVVDRMRKMVWFCFDSVVKKIPIDKLGTPENMEFMKTLFSHYEVTGADAFGKIRIRDFVKHALGKGQPTIAKKPIGTGQQGILRKPASSTGEDETPEEGLFRNACEGPLYIADIGLTLAAKQVFSVRNIRADLSKSAHFQECIAGGLVVPASRADVKRYEQWIKQQQVVEDQRIEAASPIIDFDSRTGEIRKPGSQYAPGEIEAMDVSEEIDVGATASFKRGESGIFGLNYGAQSMGDILDGS